jgi:integrase
MAPKRRSEKRRNFPDNLYETGGYYSWKNPKTGEHLGIGRDKRQAFKQAIAANLHIGHTHPSLIERIERPQVRTWGLWLDEYDKILLKRKGRNGRPLSANTLRTYKSLLRRCRTDIDQSLPLDAVSTLVVAAAIDALEDSGKARMAQSFRSFLHDCFRVSIRKGWRKDNPAEVTDTISVAVKRARLTFDVFMRLYKATEVAELKNGMALALVSGQSREMCVAAVFKQFKDEEWWCERGKTGARLRIPMALRLDCFGMSLVDVVRQCRATGIASQFLLHRTQRAKGARVGKSVHPDVLTRLFTAEIAKLGIDWADKEPPTFHEIRSLSERLHQEQGSVNTQDLLAHKDPRTTATYHDPRGEWVRVIVRKE